MDKKLNMLFGYQHFAQNKRLAKLIEETESRQVCRLSDADLELVNAAGELEKTPRDKEERR